ncbi:DUF2231 domain-containing protein [Gordonia hydrophobica]|uniref:DUF2231 domain-containing protein n=1 Tax=Gordonia hydrophobica TaxID=40516 RepID=A0ABZ2U2R1_9ACTN|nr:DUF2231 domain-containing protein [Gordonia hydrophobica]MBM7369054.1 putative membrane protein [Gordonia hydrophobica]
MESTPDRAKHPASAALAGPYGHPYHPILVTVPIGAWVTSLVFDVASHIVADPAFLNRGALWLIGIGVLGALAAATVGSLDLLMIPTRTPAFRTGIWHMSLMLAVTVGFGAGFAWRAVGMLDGPVPFGPLVLTVICLVVLTIAGSLGGKLAYRYGVRVADEATQATGFLGAERSANTY